MARSEQPPAGVAQTSEEFAWLEPLDAYRRLRAAGLQPSLLASAGAHPQARWSFVAFDPAVEVRLEDGTFEERWADGAVEAGPAEPLAYLQACFDRHRAAGTQEAPFTGGWVGYLGFGLARSIEPSLPAMPGGGPDAVLRLTRAVLAFDHATKRVHLHASDLDGDLASAAERLEATRAALEHPAPLGGAVRVGPWTASLGREAFEARVEALQELVRDGDHFQANLATRFDARLEGDPADLFAHLLAANPSPYMALLEYADHALVSASPEELLSHRDGLLRSRPIAGTRRRAPDAATDEAQERELRSDAKELAEHTMLVDLVRNDLSRVAVPGTTHVPELASIERYRHVMHLASRVEAQARPGTGVTDWIAALFPGGTVTGAPKVRAVQRILECEPVPRGPYTGSAGYVDFRGNASWNILIRTLVLRRAGGDGVWEASVHAGSGIVAGSVASREWDEACAKAQALLDAAAGLRTGHDPGRLGHVTAHAAWTPPRPASRHAGARVLLVDNYDSFVHNLADQFAALGAATRVVRNDADWRQALAEHRATHVVLSPGPGWPRQAGCTMEAVRELHGRLPLLGVCLGHQAIGEAFGSTVARHPRGPVHGEPADIHHKGDGLFAGLPTPLRAARYHSLVVEAAPPRDWAVDARLADGTVMALRHLRHPTHGLQFHPESLCTPLGLELIDRFLSLARPETGFLPSGAVAAQAG